MGLRRMTWAVLFAMVGWVAVSLGGADAWGETGGAAEGWYLRQNNP